MWDIPTLSNAHAMNENQISQIVLDASFMIHKELGPGLLESVYEEILCFELYKRGLSLSRQQAIPVTWNELTLDLAFRSDLIIDQKVLIELKSVDVLAPVHTKQVLTYLKLTGLRLGLLINFNESLLKDGIRRVVNRL
jgi:GxxExxY protein